MNAARSCRIAWAWRRSRPWPGGGPTRGGRSPWAGACPGWWPSLPVEVVGQHDHGPRDEEGGGHDGLDDRKLLLPGRQGREEVDGGDAQAVDGVVDEREQETDLGEAEEQVLVDVLDGVEGVFRD